MDIHLGNIRGQLGYDPKNPDYIAVQDCLDTGVPSVQVLRVKGGDESGNSSSHELYISPDLQYSDEQTERSLIWDIEIDGAYYGAGVSDDSDYMEEYLKKNQNTLGITGEYVGDETQPSHLHIYSITNERKFVRLIPNYPYTSDMKISGNSTVSIDKDGVISFWLEANSEYIPDDGGSDGGVIEEKLSYLFYRFIQVLNNPNIIYGVIKKYIGNNLEGSLLTRFDLKEEKEVVPLV